MAPQLKKKLQNVLVVCHGNICRSPLAGYVLRSILGTERVLDQGLGATEGRIVAKKVREWGNLKGIDLSGHRSTRVTQQEVVWADLIVYMDSGNRERLKEFPGALEKASCLAEEIGESRIPDPNYLPRGRDLDRILDMVVRASTNLGRRLK